MTTIRDLLARGRTLSFEFFPPKTHEAQAKLRATVDMLEKVEPDFVSVTYGAGGTTRETTRETVLDLVEHRTFPAMPHLTCVGHSYAEVVDLIDVTTLRQTVRQGLMAYANFRVDVHEDVDPITGMKRS